MLLFYIGSDWPNYFLFCVNFRDKLGFNFYNWKLWCLYIWQIILALKTVDECSSSIQCSFFLFTTNWGTFKIEPTAYYPIFQSCPNLPKSSEKKFELKSDRLAFVWYWQPSWLPTFTEKFDRKQKSI